jgi:hypothetical protein
MKVDIRHRESKNLWRQVTGESVTINVAFSDEEKGVISRCNLGGTVAFTVPPTGSSNQFRYVTIDDLLAGSWSAEFPDTFTAQDSAGIWKAAMVEVKTRISSGAEEQPMPDSFEL